MIMLSRLCVDAKMFNLCNWFIWFASSYFLCIFLTYFYIYLQNNILMKARLCVNYIEIIYYQF